jgi:hypothetical protein
MSSNVIELFNEVRELVGSYLEYSDYGIPNVNPFEEVIVQFLGNNIKLNDKKVLRYIYCKDWEKCNERIDYLVKECPDFETVFKLFLKFYKENYKNINMWINAKYFPIYPSFNKFPYLNREKLFLGME